MTNINSIYNFVNHLRKKANLKKVLNTKDLINLITVLGGKINFKDMSFDIDGIINNINENKFEIILNKKFLDNKKLNFLITHELGHLFIHMKFLNPKIWQENFEYIDSTFYRQEYIREEIEANEFAFELLMPKNEFIKKAKDFSNHNKCNIEKLAEFFNVSSEIVLSRGENLGIFIVD